MSMSICCSYTASVEKIVGVLETCTENVFPTEQLQVKILSLMWAEQKLRHVSFPSGKQHIPRRKPIQTEDNVINILA